MTRFFDRLYRNTEMRRRVLDEKQPTQEAARRVYRDIYYI